MTGGGISRLQHRKWEDWKVYIIPQIVGHQRVLIGPWLPGLWSSDPFLILTYYALPRG